MCRVLVTAYYFPPQGGGGVQRTVKFLKYLPDFGWQPVVLTIKKCGIHLIDDSIKNEVPPSVPVHRTSALVLPQWLPWRVRTFVARWLLVVDEQLGWFPFAVRRGKRLISHENIRAIYTTSAPYTDHLIGFSLKRQTGLPWIADFRDPWVDNFALTFPSKTHYRLAAALERQVFLTADRIVVNTERSCEFYQRKYPMLDRGRLIPITNGYDLADFEGIEPIGQESNRLVIVHNGSLYGQQQTPLPFLRGLWMALDDGRVFGERIRVRFVGNVNPAIHKIVEDLTLADVVQLTGYVPHRQSVGYLLGADVLLLILGCGKGSDMVFPAKIFEYLVSGKPILGVVPPGISADLVQEAQAGVIVNPEDVRAIADQIAALYEAWQQGELKITGNQDVVARYDRRLLTGQLARVLDEVAK